MAEPKKVGTIEFPQSGEEIATALGEGIILAQNQLRAFRENEEPAHPAQSPTALIEVAKECAQVSSDIEAIFGEGLFVALNLLMGYEMGWMQCERFMQKSRPPTN